MISFGPLTLAAPAVLAGLAALPLLWWLIRRLPPPTKRVVFPAVRLLGPVVEQPPPQARPPWWLLLIRLGALTLLLLGLAGPSWDPTPDVPAPKRLLIVLDNGWESAAGWQEMLSAARNRIEALRAEDARVALVATTPPPGGWPDNAVPAPSWVTPRTALALLEQHAPRPWPADREGAARAIARLAPGSADEALWVSTGWGTEGVEPLGAALEAVGPARLLTVPARMFAIRQFDGTAGGWRVQLVRPAGLPAETVRLTAIDTAGRPRAEAAVTFAANETSATVRLGVAVGDLARISRLTVAESRSAATTALIDAATLHPRVAILSGERRGEPRPLQSAAFYVRRALEPYASVDTVAVEAMTTTEANLRVFLDLPVNNREQSEALMRWVRQGGIAITFAGPRIAQNGTRLAPGPLLTATRAVGTRLSWDKPQKLGGFAADGPLAGLEIDPDVTVTRQVLVADPSAPGLMRWAWLEDGTPLVTARTVGAGALVMVHANADPRWTNLPLSGLFEQMLRRFLPLVGRTARPAGAPEGSFMLEAALDGEGLLTNPPQPRQITPQAWENAAASPATPPGLYRAGSVTRALNLMQGNGPISPRFRFEPLADAAGLPVVSGEGARAPINFAPPLLILGLLLAIIDGFLSLGKPAAFRWWPKRAATAAAVATLALLAGLVVAPGTGHAQSFPGLVPRELPADQNPATAVEPVLLGYVTTGNPAADSRARTGLEVLTKILRTRTAVRAGSPQAVNLERDELGTLALIYWPLTGGGAGARPLSPEAAARLSAYLASGGLLVVDLGATPPPPEAVRQVLQPLGLPRLAPLDSDHVLSRSFYLLDRYPGRVQGQTVWVEAGTEGGEDGAVAGVVMGSADWAGAWASHENINARQREWALRFGVNLVMYALTGTYKADQVHVKAILDRLPERKLMTALALDPLIPHWALWLLVLLLAAPGLLALWRRRWLTGAARLAVALIAFAILARPITRTEERRAEPDIAVAVVDTSASMAIGQRRAEAEAALKALRAASGPDLQWRVVESEGRPGATSGTALMDEIGRAIGQTPAGRLAGAVVISDGLVVQEHPPVLPEGKPVHVLLAGDRNMVDRRMVVEAAPPYAVVGQTAQVTMRVEGGAPGLPVNWSIDGQPQQPVTIDAKGLARLPVEVARRGPATVTASVPPAPGELVTSNNAALVRLNGVRDRLAVLLVSGAPSLSTRSWRDILTLDAALDTVHFTILRLPSSFDPTPTEELSLIPFPVEQLFEERLRRFDLIVLDRFDQLDLLSATYFDAISDYVREGGALLVVAGPEHQQPFGLSGTSVGRMLPARPTGAWETTPYRAAVTDDGKRHPITATLQEEWGLDRPWGRWRTHLPSTAARGHTLLSGPGDSPLLVVDRQGRGRIGQLMALDVWSWGRGVDGGGPRDALLTRLVHWLMREPDLEEEQLSAQAQGDDRLDVSVRTMTEPEPVVITPPQGQPQRFTPQADAKGVARLTVPAPVPGLYRIESGNRRTFALVGAGPERQEVRPRAEPLASLAEQTGGGAFWLADGMPSLRRTAADRPQTGNGWLGLIRNDAGALLGVREEPLVPPLVLWSLLAAALGLAWVAERRR